MRAAISMPVDPRPPPANPLGRSIVDRRAPRAKHWPSYAEGQNGNQESDCPSDPGQNRPQTPDFLRKMTVRTLTRDPRRKEAKENK